MPRSFEVSFDSPASVAQVHAAFADRDYWLARLAAVDGVRTLNSLTVDPDGTVHVVATEDLRHGALPRPLAAVYRRDLTVVTTERWTPAGDGRVDGTVVVAVNGAPGSGHGTGALTRRGAGCQLALSATLEFKMPLVGGKIEDYLVGVFTDGLGIVQRFTTEWIAAHG